MARSGERQTIVAAANLRRCSPGVERSEVAPAQWTTSLNPSAGELLYPGTRTKMDKVDSHYVSSPGSETREVHCIDARSDVNRDDPMEFHCIGTRSGVENTGDVETLSKGGVMSGDSRSILGGDDDDEDVTFTEETDVKILPPDRICPT
jgi:hypothetical protein